MYKNVLFFRLFDQDKKQVGGQDEHGREMIFETPRDALLFVDKWKDEINGPPFFIKPVFVFFKNDDGISGSIWSPDNEFTDIDIHRRN